MSQQIFHRHRGMTWILWTGIFLIPVLLTGASAHVSWNPNQESDLAGYQVHYGTNANSYSMIVDVEKATQYEVKNLTIGQTYYFAVTAYDNSGNVSEFSEEKVFTAQDAVAPTLTSVRLLDADRLKVMFSEPLNEASAKQVSNYQINNSIVIQRAELQPDLISVVLYTVQHANGSYILTVNNVTDQAVIPNVIAANTTANYTWDKTDDIKPAVLSVELVGLNHVKVNFSEPVDQVSAKTLANYQISGISIVSASLTDDFMSTILTTSEHTPGSSYTIAVSNVKDAAANVMLPTSKSYTAPSTNTQAPALISAVSISSTEVQVQFSEVVSLTTAQNKSNYSIAPGITVLGATLSASKTTVTLSTSAHSSGSYTVTVSGVQDTGVPPLTMNGSQLIYNYTPPDNVKPQVVSAEISNSTLLLVKFNELIDQNSAVNLTNYSISPTVSVVNAATDNTGMNVLLITAEHPAGNFTLSVKGVKDVAQNVMDNTTKTYSYTPPDRTPPVLVSAAIEGASFVELVFSEELDRTSALILANYAISPSIAITQADLEAVNGNRIYLKTAAHQSGQNYTITVTNVRDKALNTIQPGSNTAGYTAPVMDNTPPVLVEVEALGPKMLELTFSESMDEVTIRQTANYTIAGITVQEASLDISKRTVYLKTGEHQSGSQYEIRVNNVKDLAGNPVASVQSMSYTLPTQDTQPPTIRKAELVSDKVLLITFSESVDAGTAGQIANYQINNDITIQKVNLSSGNMEVWLETSMHQRGTFQLTVKNIKDQMNNTMVSTVREYEYSPADNDPPKLINVFVASPYTLELWFDEVLEPVSAETKANYSVKNAVDQTNITVTRSTLDRTGKVVTLITGEHVPGNYAVDATGIKDGNGGNVSATLSMSYAYTTTDKTPPAIQGVYTNSSTQLVIQFSEALETTSASLKTNYTVNNGITVKSVFLNMDGDVILETSEHAAGEYILTVNGIKDASGNLIQAYTQSKYQWNPNDTAPPQLLAASLISNNYLELTFNEPVNATDAEAIANYIIEPYLAIQKATLSAKSPEKVYLFTEGHLPGTYQVKVNNVRDRAFVPNVIKTGNVKTYVYTTPDTEPPKIVTVEAKSPYTVYVHFDESVSMEEAQNKANYLITPNIQVNLASLLDNRRTVLLETSIHDGGISYKIEVRNLKDRSPIPNTMPVPQTYTYSYTTPDQEKPKLMSAKLMRSDYLELIFSEPVEKSSAETRSNYDINPKVEIANAVLDLETQRKVYLETSQHLPMFTYTISVRNVRDLAPVPNMVDQYTSRSYTMGSTTSGAGSDSAPEVLRIEPLSTTQIDVVFNKQVDKATAENKDNYLINDGAISVTAAIIDTNLTRIHLSAETHTPGQAYQIQVRNIKDRSAVPKILVSTPRIQYILASGLAISGVSHDDYQLALFTAGSASYIDRDYTVVQAPAYLNGSVRVITANDDKISTGTNFLSFELKGSANCLVAYDARIDSIPVWLSGWEETGDKVVDSRDNVFTLYQKMVQEGKVLLGGNSGSMDDAMYMVFAIAQKACGSLITSLNKSNYQLAHLTQGDVIYIDRDYTLASMPASMNGLLWLKTANDDKRSEGDNFLNFNISDSSQVYIAYDAQISAVPSWLDSWELIPGQVVDSRGARFEIFSKSFSPGKVMVGGNYGSLDDNMYLVALQSYAADDKWSKMPGFFTLNQNYPNPFNPITNIRYAVHKPGHVMLSIYNVLGQQVKVLVDREQIPGEFSEQWDATDYRGLAVCSGIYFYRIQVGNFAKTKRMMLVR